MLNLDIRNKMQLQYIHAIILWLDFYNADSFQNCICACFYLVLFFFDSIAFISGTQRDTVCPLGLAWLKFGHMLRRMFTGPSYSSASEVISIFWMMSFKRLLCFSNIIDISFILRRRTAVHVAQWPFSTLIQYRVKIWHFEDILPSDLMWLLWKEI